MRSLSRPRWPENGVGCEVGLGFRVAMGVVGRTLYEAVPPNWDTSRFRVANWQLEPKM